MWKIFSFFLLFSLLHHYSHAQQPCTDEGIMNTKGSWKKNNDANIFPDNSFPRNQFELVNARIDKIQKLLQTAYPELKGIEAEWYHSITGDALLKGGPVPYALNSLFLAYFCNTYEKRIELGGETGTWLYVWANQLNSWFAEYINIYTIHKLPVYLLNKKVGVLNGYPLYEGTHKKYSRAIIITRTGQLPYLPVTQKQFLKAFINFNEKRNIKHLAVDEKIPVKTDEEEEIYKKEQLAKIEKNTAHDKLTKASENFLKGYKTDKQRRDEGIAKSKKFYEDELKPARILLADSLKTDLEQPAILDYSNLLEFKKFATKDEDGQELVRLNPDYFNMNLPKYIPQLLIVHWSWNDNKPANYWRAQVEKNFNFNALQQMLDK